MALYLSHLHGQKLDAIALDADTHEWVFTFGGHCALRVAAPWRMVSAGHVVVGYEASDSTPLLRRGPPMQGCFPLETYLHVSHLQPRQQ